MTKNQKDKIDDLFYYSPINTEKTTYKGVTFEEYTKIESDLNITIGFGYWIFVKSYIFLQRYE